MLPEFAEYACAACHHSLGKEERPGKGSTLGRMPWGTWYNPLLPTLAGATKADHKKLDGSLERLEGLMRKRIPNKALVGKEALAFATELRVWEKQIARQRFDGDQTKALMKALAARQDLVRSGWDGGTQVYLSLAALNHGLSPSERPDRTGPGG